MAESARDNSRPIAVGDNISVAAWHFDTKQDLLESRWSYQQHGAQWRTARCHGKAAVDMGKGQWEIAWTEPGWEGASDMVKTTALRLEPEDSSSSRRDATSRVSRARPVVEPGRAVGTESADSNGSLLLGDVTAQRSHVDEDTAGVSPAVPKSGGTRNGGTLEVQETHSKRQRLEDAAMHGGAESETDAASDAASETPPALAAGPLAQNIEPSSDEALAAAEQAAVAPSPTEQASVGVGKPDTEPMRKAGGTQCQRHPLCKRGFNHGGSGGHCSFKEKGDRRPSSNSATAARRPSVVTDASPTDAAARAAAPEQQDTRSLQPIVNADTNGGELLSLRLLDNDNLPSWMLHEEMPAAKADLKLWDGAAAEGWRVLPKYRGAEARNNWLYLAPSGAQMRNRTAALAAAADGGAAAAAAAKTGTAAERGSRALGSGASSGDPRRPSGCLRKRPRATQSAAAVADYSKEFGAALVETACDELELWQPTRAPASITAAETAQRMKATVPRDSLAIAAHPDHRCRSQASCSTAATASSAAAAAAAAAALPKLGGIRHVLEQVARSGASLRARDKAAAVLASVDSPTPPSPPSPPSPAPHVMPANGIAACSTLAPEEGVECVDTDHANGESGKMCGMDAACIKPSGHKGLCDVPSVDRSSRARRLPKWQLGAEGGVEALASQPSPSSVKAPKPMFIVLPAGAEPSVPPPPTGWAWPAEGESIEVEVKVSDDTPPAWIASKVLQVLVDGQFEARIVLPDGSDQWEDWFSWQEEGTDWRRGKVAGKQRMAACDEDEGVDAGWEAGQACWGIYYEPSRGGNARGESEQSSAQAAAMTDATATSAADGEGTSSGAVGKSAVKWFAPAVGRHVMVQVDGSWSKGEVMHIVTRRGQSAVSVSVEDGATRNYSQKDEGKTWRRVAPAVGTLVEVEVDEEGEVSWRSASVRKRSVGDFTAVVLYPDGMPDEDFVEKYSVSDEGVEWRYVNKPLGKKGKAASRAADPSLAIGFAGTTSAGGEPSPSGSSLVTPSPSLASKGLKKARFSRETVALLEAAFGELNGVTPAGEALAEVRHRLHQPAPAP